MKHAKPAIDEGNRRAAANKIAQGLMALEGGFSGDNPSVGGVSSIDLSNPLLGNLSGGFPNGAPSSSPYSGPCVSVVCLHDQTQELTSLTATTMSQPTSEFWGAAGNVAIPFAGLTSPIANPSYSQALVDSFNSVQIFIALKGGWGVSSNGPGVGDYLYNPVLPYLVAKNTVKTIVNGWMKFTNNNPIMMGPIVVMPTILITGNQNLGIPALFQEDHQQMH
jgi:hypothetical protein